VLSDKEILEHLRKGEIKIAPFEALCLNPAGYDLRSHNKVVMKPEQHVLIATLEKVELGLRIVAFLHIRSSLAREGISGSFAVVDPGFRGQLTLNIQNTGKHEVTIHEREPIVQIVFHKLGKPVEKGYAGSYQDSRGIVPSRRHSHARTSVLL